MHQKIDIFGCVAKNYKYGIYKGVFVEKNANNKFCVQNKRDDRNDHPLWCL